ncbi:hypothetical protein D3C86_2046960 [compost metagenome]
MHLVAMGEQQQLGQVGVGHQRIDRMANRDADAALGDLRQPAGAPVHALAQPGKQAAGDVGGVGQ